MCSTPFDKNVPASNAPNFSPIAGPGRRRKSRSLSSRKSVYCTRFSSGSRKNELCISDIFNSDVRKSIESKKNQEAINYEVEILKKLKNSALKELFMKHYVNLAVNKPVQANEKAQEAVLNVVRLFITFC